MTLAISITEGTRTVTCDDCGTCDRATFPPDGARLPLGLPAGWRGHSVESEPERHRCPGCAYLARAAARMGGTA